MDASGTFGCFDHAEGDAVFHRAAGGEEFAFGEEGAFEAFLSCDFGEGDERCVADVRENVLGDAEGGMRQRWVAETRVGGRERCRDIVW